MQITRTTPARLITLQLRQILLTDARTFMSHLRSCLSGWSIDHNLLDLLFSVQNHTDVTSDAFVLVP
jgi:hypothetical protein